MLTCSSNLPPKASHQFLAPSPVLRIKYEWHVPWTPYFCNLIFVGMTLETAGAYTHLHVRSTEYSARILFNPQTTDLTFSLLSTSFCDRSDTWRPSSLVSSDRMV